MTAFADTRMLARDVAGAYLPSMIRRLGLVVPLLSAGLASCGEEAAGDESSALGAGSDSSQPTATGNVPADAPSGNMQASPGQNTSTSMPSVTPNLPADGSSSTPPVPPPGEPVPTDPTSDATAPATSPAQGSGTAGAGGTGEVPSAGGGAGGGVVNPGGGGASGAGTSGGGTSGGSNVDGGSGGGGAAGGANPGGAACPGDASFCTDFETADLPAGAVFKLNGDPATPWTALFEVDGTQAYSGASSLRVRKNSEPGASTMYKMLAVPSGGASFWVRLYVRSDVELGQEGHNAYAIASATDDPNDAAKVEFADDVGLSFNASDDVRWPEGYGRLNTGETNPFTLAANAWHCIELHFDGSGRTQSLFVDGEELIVASSYPSSDIAFGTFKFGYLGYHNEADRTVWYDAVAVGPSRIGCASP